MQNILLVVFCFTLSIASNIVAAQNYSKRAEVKEFIQEFSVKHKYPESSLIELFSKVKKQTDVLEAIQRPAEKKKNWQQYRKIFVTPKRVQQGIDFWSENAQILADAERRYGVPPEIVVAIIGVETFYGKYKGKYPVLDSLVTLGFDYPPRQAFFRSELEHFLLLAREEELNPQTITGSYAGAMGKSQFISSSYRHYAVDFDGNGVRDLWESNEDVIGSVAFYFKRHGWVQGEPVTIPAMVKGEAYLKLLDKGIKPAITVAELSNYGVSLSAEVDTDAKDMLALLELNNDDSNEYWVGFGNFYAITRYNHSHMYAMAVYQLSQKIKQNIQGHVAEN